MPGLPNKFNKFWSDFAGGIQAITQTVAPIVQSVAPMFGPRGQMVSDIAGAVGQGVDLAGRLFRGGRNTTADYQQLATNISNARDSYRRLPPGFGRQPQ